MRRSTLSSPSASGSRWVAASTRSRRTWRSSFSRPTATPPTRATSRGRSRGGFATNLSDRTDVNLSLRGHSGEWNGPGYIPQDQFLSDDARRLQGPNAEDDGGAKTFYAERIGLNHSFSDRLRLLTYGYAVQQDFTRFAKFGYNAGGQSERSNQRDVLGGGTSLNGQAALASVPVQFVVGAEVYSERTQRRRWATQNRVRQAQTEDRDFTVQNAAAFVQAELDVSPYLRPTLGLRFDTFFGEFEGNDPGQAPVSSGLNDYSHLSPKLGLRSTVAPGLDLRASATNGYILPNGADKYDATLDVDPAEIWQVELGATYDAGPVRLDLVGYQLDTSDEIVEDPPGSGTFRNAGQTRRRGVEAARGREPVPWARRARGARLDRDRDPGETPTPPSSGARSRASRSGR